MDADVVNVPFPMMPCIASDYHCRSRMSVLLYKLYLPGTPCWVELPWEPWPKWLQEYIIQMARWASKGYMRRLKRYGHPDSGTMWEKHCDESVTALQNLRAQ